MFHRHTRRLKVSIMGCFSCARVWLGLSHGVWNVLAELDQSRSFSSGLGIQPSGRVLR